MQKIAVISELVVKVIVSPLSISVFRWRAYTSTLVFLPSKSSLQIYRTVCSVYQLRLGVSNRERRLYRGSLLQRLRLSIGDFFRPSARSRASLLPPFHLLYIPLFLTKFQDRSWNAVEATLPRWRTEDCCKRCCSHMSCCRYSHLCC